MGQLFGAAPVDDVRLAREVAPRVASLRGNLPDQTTLRTLASEYGTDFAAAAFYHAIKAAPGHRDFIEQVDRQPLLDNPRKNGVKLLVVPAFFYREYPEVGGSGQHVVDAARACGIDAQRVEINSVGSIDGNIAIILEALQRAAGREIWLLSISKGGAEVRLMLQDHAASLPLEDLRLWFNVGGLVNGCELVDHMLSKPVRRLKTRAICVATGADYQALEELRTDRACWQEPLSLPQNLQVVNIFGVPLLSHLQKTLLARYHRLKHLGPNDGMVLLARASIPATPIYPLWGADHFMRDVRVFPLLYRLFGLFLSRPSALAALRGLAAKPLSRTRNRRE